MATSLIPYMASINSDITKFNMHVMALKDQLARRGGQTTDLLENLFTTYESVKDSNFAKYLETKRNAHDDDTAPLTAENLMQLMKNKYETLKEQEKWNLPTEQEQKILALESKLAKLDKGKQSDKKGKNEKKKKGKYNGKKGKKKDEAWMAIKPPPGKPDEPLKREGKIWYYCTKHQRRCLHKTSECKGLKVEKNSDSEETPKETPQQKSTRKAKLVRALQAISEEDLDSDEE
jgi:hypothetical protein